MFIHVQTNKTQIVCFLGQNEHFGLKLIQQKNLGGGDNQKLHVILFEV